MGARYRNLILFLLPVLLSFALHFRIFNLDVIGIHVWRQAQTQTTVYHFSSTDNNLLHPKKFDLNSGSNELLYEFPLYQWLSAQLNRAFGYDVLHTRLFSFLCFALTLLAFYKWIRHWFSPNVALITNAFLCFSPILYYYCVNPLPDVLALCFILWYLYFFQKHQQQGAYGSFLFAALFLMLASLVKLPFAIFAVVLVPHLFGLLKQKQMKTLLLHKFSLLLCLIPVVLWYAKAIPTWNQNGIVRGVLSNEKTFAELLEYFWAHLVSTFPELISNYAAFPFILYGIWWILRKKKLSEKKARPFLFLFVLLCLYFFFELNMIEKTHDYYLFPFVPLIFLVLAFGIRELFETRFKYLILFALFLSPLTAWLRIQHRWDEVDPGFHRAYLYEQKAIQAAVPNNAICIVDQDDSRFIALYYLKRYGYSLYKNEISPNKLKDLYQKGANHLVTENLAFDPLQYPDFHFLQVYSGSIKIYKSQKP